LDIFQQYDRNNDVNFYFSHFLFREMLEKKLPRRSLLINASGATNVYVLEDGLDSIKLAGVAEYYEYYEAK